MVLINTEQIVYCRGNPHLREVALTFDDGPCEPYTGEILDILKGYNVKATFFMVGRNVDKFPETAKRVAAGGHEIGNHTYSHTSLVLDTRRKIAMELEKGGGGYQELDRYFNENVSPPVWRKYTVDSDSGTPAGVYYRQMVR